MNEYEIYLYEMKKKQESEEAYTTYLANKGKEGKDK